MKIISNSAISLDGKLTTAYDDRWAFGSDEDKRRMSILRNGMDGVLIGGNTFRHWPNPRLPDTFSSTDSIWNIVLSHNMDVPLTSTFVGEAHIEKLFITTSGNKPDDFPCEVISGADEIDPQWIVDELADRGLKTLILEGGGILLESFLRAELLDEMYVTLCPKLMGGKATTLVEGEGFKMDDVKSLILLDHEVVEDEIFLHYEVVYP